MGLVQLLAFLKEAPLATLDGFKDGVKLLGATVGVAVLQPLLQLNTVDVVVIEQDSQQQPTHLFISSNHHSSSL